MVPIIFLSVRIISSSPHGTEQPVHLIKLICGQFCIIPHKVGIKQLTSLVKGEMELGQRLGDRCFAALADQQGKMIAEAVSLRLCIFGL